MPPNCKIYDRIIGVWSMIGFIGQQKILENPDIEPLTQASLVRAEDRFPALGETRAIQ